MFLRLRARLKNVKEALLLRNVRNAGVKEENVVPGKPGEDVVPEVKEEKEENVVPEEVSQVNNIYANV